MAFDLNQFRNALLHGGARPSQFEMEITWPVNIPSGIIAGSNFRFLCRVSKIPEATIGKIDIPYFGRKLKFAGDREFGDLTVTVINDEDYKVRHAFEDWMRAITGHSTTVSQYNGGIATDTVSALSYATEGIVTQLSRNDRGTGQQHAYRFVGMWPSSLGEVALDWANYDAIEEFTVQFQYQWWEPVQTLGFAL